MTRYRLQRSLLLPLLLLALVTGAALGQPLTALPIGPILTTPVEVGSVTPTTATLRIGTSIDVACVVVYGPDEGFGQLALDQDMGLGAHRDHVVVMRGLEPDSAYLYRLQGSDPQGNFYVSEVFGFRTPAAPEGATETASASAELGRNVALLELGAEIVAVSSNFGGGDNSGRWGADNAIDGDPDSEWSSFGDGNEAFLSVRLPEPVEVSGFGLWTRTMGTSAQIRSFLVESDAGEIFGPFQIPDASGVFAFPAQGRGRTFTFRVVDSSGGNTGVVEVAVFTRDAP